jgi:hypothetical protein
MAHQQWLARVSRLLIAVGGLLLVQASLSHPILAVDRNTGRVFRCVSDRPRRAAGQAAKSAAPGFLVV